MQKISTMRTSGKSIFEGQLTIGVDLGDRSGAYCVLNEAGEIVLEHKLATTPEAMKQVFGSMPRCRIAMETAWLNGKMEKIRQRAKTLDTDRPSHGRTLPVFVVYNARIPVDPLLALGTPDSGGTHADTLAGFALRPADARQEPYADVGDCGVPWDGNRR